MRRSIITFGLIAALVLGLATARMANATVLVVGGNYSTIDLDTTSGPLTVGGGSIDPSSVGPSLSNQTPLKYLYCLNYNLPLNAPGTYLQTTVTTNGYVYGSLVNNAGEVAWLLSNYGSAGQGPQEIALQAAIWHVIYGNVSLDPSQSAAYGYYNQYLTALGGNTGNVANFLWISPGTSGNTKYQGLVGSVPEPATFILFGFGMLGLAIYGKRSRTAQSNL
jgi:hypothetical protein